MNEEALEIETLATQTSSEESIEVDTGVSADIPLADAQSEVPDTDGEATDSPLDPQNSGALEDADEGAGLRAEIDKLKAELDGIVTKRAEFISEIKEFASIFGAESISGIPDEVWESTNRGVPLAAAYALYEKKAMQRAELTARVNKKNASMSAGAINNATSSDFFSPAEVRAMSAKEVKKNYNRIIESMKKWN